MSETPAPLPVTVIAGYLGAGKTSLVNHLLRHAGGRRIMVLVNDFGDIAIDADLLESTQEDTLSLANGCVCCTLGADLMYALADALDRRPRPDCLVIEASGVAQPRKIAEAARAEPEMRYCGIVTLVDAANIAATLADPRIGAQAADQIAAADLLVLTKTDLAPRAPAEAAIRRLSAAPLVVALRGALDPDLVLERPASAAPGVPQGHHHHDHGETYRSWSYAGPAWLDPAGIERLLGTPLSGLYRLKGRVRLVDGTGAELHLVGRTYSLERIAAPATTEIVAIGVAPEFDPGMLARLWSEIARE